MDCFCVGDEALYYKTFVRWILERGEEFLEAFGESCSCEGFSVGFGVHDVDLLFGIPDLPSQHQGKTIGRCGGVYSHAG